MPKHKSQKWLDVMRSPEYREKMRANALRIGSKPPPGKIGNKNALGVKHTAEWKRERSEWNKKNNHKPPVHFGKDNPRWNNDATPLRVKLWGSMKYRQWRSDIFTRDGFTCQDCGEKGGELHAHHINPLAKILRENHIISLDESLICEEIWNLNNGITLCKECHTKVS